MTVLRREGLLSTFADARSLRLGSHSGGRGSFGSCPYASAAC